jgi:hypothetical protein
MRLRMLGVGVALLAVLAVSAMAVASSAMANEDVCVQLPLPVPPETGLFMKRSTGGVCEEQLSGGGNEFELYEYLLAEWLENGVGITETMLAETTGELLIEDTKAPIVGKAAATCSYIEVGDIGPDGARDATEVLNLAKEAISSTPLVGTSLACTDETDCESPHAWPVGLPWLVLLELWEIETPLVSDFIELRTSTLAGGAIGWYLECTELGVKDSEECTVTLGVSADTNVATGVEVEFSKTFTESQDFKFGTCSGSKEESGVLEGKAVIATSLAGPLTVSE